MASYKSVAKSLYPLQEANHLLAIEDMQELEPEELDSLGAEQGDDILIAAAEFTDGTTIALNLMSGQANYWLEWAAFRGGSPLSLMFEPEFELLERDFEIPIGDDVYLLHLDDLFEG